MSTTTRIFTGVMLLELGKVVEEIHLKARQSRDNVPLLDGIASDYQMHGIKEQYNKILGLCHNLNATFKVMAHEIARAGAQQQEVKSTHE